MYRKLSLMIGACLHIANTAKLSYLRNHPIVYPGPMKESPFNRYGNDLDPSLPEECKNQTYCTIKPWDYPQEKFNNFFNGVTPVVQPTLVLEPEFFGNRQGDPTEKDDCDATVTYEPIFKVKTTAGDWRTVIQAHKQNYVQMIRLETCKKPGGRCFKVFPDLPGYVTSCKQKFNVWELLVDGANGPEKVEASLPVCCVCTYKAVSSI